jgi:hypothetical protein
MAVITRRRVGRPLARTEQDVASALQRNAGNILHTAHDLGTGAVNVRRYMERWPNLFAVAEEARELARARAAVEDEEAFQVALSCKRVILVNAQNKLYDKAAGKPREVPLPLEAEEREALKFFATRTESGRDRFAARSEMTGANGQPLGPLVSVNVKLSPDQIRGMTDDEIASVLDGDIRVLDTVQQRRSARAAVGAPDGARARAGTTPRRKDSRPAR